MGELRLVEQQQEPLEVASWMQDGSKFETMCKVASTLAKSNLVPDALRGNDGDVLLMLDIAERTGLAPMVVLQNTYVIKGKPAMEAKLVIALALQSGVFKGAIDYKESGQGDTRTCQASIVVKETGEVIYGPVVRLGAVRKNTDPWRATPELMLRYRAATYLIRSAAPHTMFGLTTREEMEDVDAKTIQVESIQKQADDLLATLPEPEPKAESVEIEAEVIEPEPEAEVDPMEEVRNEVAELYAEFGKDIPEGFGAWSIATLKRAKKELKTRRTKAINAYKNACAEAGVSPRDDATLVTMIEDTVTLLQQSDGLGDDSEIPF